MVNNQKESNVIANFLKGGGEMGELTRNFNWYKTSIGNPEQWPQILQSTVSLILNSNFPMFLWWGNDLIQFYNDAYRPSLGKDGKHPIALGQKGEECWPEIWPTIKPLIDQVLAGNGATWSEDQLIPIYRNGKLEDVYWTFGYSPVFDDTGNVGGVLVICTETTQKIANFHNLQESNTQLEFAIEATQLGTWDLNPINNKFTGNNRLKEWFGVAANDEINLSEAINSIADKDREIVIKAIEKALQYSSGGLYDIEYSIIHPVTKQERIVRAKGTARFNENKIAYRFNGTLQDVTEGVRARKFLEESEKNLRNTILQAPVAMCILRGVNFVVEIANDRICELWGTGSAIIGKPIFDMLPEAKDEGYETLLKHVFQTGESYKAYGVPVTLPRKNEVEIVYIDFLYEPYREKDGTISGVLAVAVDVTEQVIARQKSEQSEQQVRSFIESAPFPIGIYIGKEMRIQFANQTILDIWGKGNDVIGKLYSQILPELGNQKIFDQLDSVYTTGVPFHAKNQRVDLIVNGINQPYYFNYSFTPLCDSNGKIYGVMNTAADVTDLNIAKKKVEDSELFARNIIQNSSAAQIIMLGEDLVFSMVNERMLKLMGSDLSIIGKRFMDIVPEISSKKLINRLMHVLHTGDLYNQPEEMFVTTRDGESHTGYYSYTYQALKNTEGVNYGILCTAIEVTEQVKARKKLEEEKERTKLALEAGELGVFEIDLKTDEIISDNRFNQIMGFDRPLNRDEYMAAFDADYIPLIERAREQMKTGVFDYEARIIHKDQTVRWVRSKGKSYLDNNGNQSKVIGVLQDITERRQAEEEMELKNIQLIRTNNDLDNFIYTASHDLKAPMSNIEGLLYTLKDSLPKNDDIYEDSEMIIQLMEKSINRFKATILDLTEITKVQKADEVDINEINLSQLVEDVKLSIYDKIAESGATIITDFSKINTLNFSKKNLRSIVYNLLSNAVKYRDKNRQSEIFIKAENSEGYTCLTIRDNGLGIHKQGRDKLFTMFKRFHDHVEGTGIGLYIVKRIMDNAGGKIEVESEVGEGTTFKLMFKLKK
jgi:PAS domain S-box-containing protein